MADRPRRNRHAPRDTDMGNRLAKAGGSDPATLVRNFADPYLEMLRLLREAAEVEHALMVQYLYAAFSVKPPYQALAGFGDPNAHDLIGVAVQEMQHLGAVNRFLAELGAAPQLDRQDFPYEPDIYPFAFDLEPLSRTSLAKYVYAEAPEDALRMDRANSEDDVAFLRDLNAALGGDVRVNHVGSLYGAIIELLRELPRSNALARWPDLEAWAEKFERDQRRRRGGSLRILQEPVPGPARRVRAGSQIWNLSIDDPAYPSMPCPPIPPGSSAMTIRSSIRPPWPWLNSATFIIGSCCACSMFHIETRSGRTRSWTLPAPTCSARSRFWPAIFRPAALAFPLIR